MFSAAGKPGAALAALGDTAPASCDDSWFAELVTALLKFRTIPLDEKCLERLSKMPLGDVLAVCAKTRTWIGQETKKLRATTHSDSLPSLRDALRSKFAQSVTCSNHPPSNTEPVDSVLQLTVQSTMAESLGKFLKESCQFRCQQCTRDVNGTKTKKFAHLPAILCLHLMRCLQFAAVQTDWL